MVSPMNAFRLAAVLAALVGLPAADAARPHGSATGQAPRTRTVLPFIADDYTRAIAEARARRVPLFIEAWAPW
jgi:hypothetical protein